jgi:CO/xanthine dehydrogenase FAD-binding subunit
MGTTRVLKKFEYFKPSSLNEALEALDQFGYGSHLLAGGTNILVDIKCSRIVTKALVDISEIKELQGIKFDGSKLIIGGATTFDEISKSGIIKDKYTALFEASQLLGTTQIRTGATIAGNICNASPAADSAPPLIVFDAEIEIVNSLETRIVSINDFFKGYKKTILRQGDILKSVILQNPPGNTGSAFMRVTRTASDLSLVNAAASLTIEGGICTEVRIAAGAVSEIPVRAVNVENMLQGKKISEKLIEEASSIIINEINPVNDVRASAQYRLDVSRVLIKKVLLKAFKETSKQ